MIDRRGVLAGGLAGLVLPQGAAAAIPGIPASGRLAFDVRRGGKSLGSHRLSFRRSGDALTVEVLVELLYKLGPVTLFHYNLHVTERWAGGEVQGFDSQANDNGTKYRTSARREGGALIVEGNAVARYAAPANALPATHWNRHELDGPWINPQDGKLLRPQVVARGPDNVPTLGGSARARRYSLSGPFKLDLWYDADDQWAGLAFTRGGGEVRYLRR